VSQIIYWNRLGTFLLLCAAVLNLTTGGEVGRESCSVVRNILYLTLILVTVRQWQALYRNVLPYSFNLISVSRFLSAFLSVLLTSFYPFSHVSLTAMITLLFQWLRGWSNITKNLNGHGSSSHLSHYSSSSSTGLKGLMKITKISRQYIQISQIFEPRTSEIQK
jgi:hypothetical protein